MLFFRVLLFIYFISYVDGQTVDQKKILERALDGSIDQSKIQEMINSTNTLDFGNNEKILEAVDNSNRQNIIDVDSQVQELLQQDQSLNDLSSPIQNESDSVDDTIENVSNENSEDFEDEDVSNENIISSRSLYGLNYFGYNIFNTDPDIFQKTTEFVDPNHIVGPGDEIIVLLWGEVELNNSFVVAKDGYIFVPNLGQVFVNGLSLIQLEKKLFALYKKVYSGLGKNSSGEASTYFDVSLGSLSFRPLRVFALGDVDKPGSYLVGSSSTIFSSLYYFNGPNVNGSMRRVELIRNGKKVKTIDLYPYLLEGIEKGDMPLQRNDVVFIPPRGKTITVTGEIRRPAIYELLDEEKLDELISISGGLLATTYMKRLQIDRIIPPEQRIVTGIDRTIIDVSLVDVVSKKVNLELKDGDVLTFFSISNSKENFVTINGSISRPGTYDLGSGLNVLELIKKADGVLGDTYLKRAEIIRQKSDLSTELIKFNLGLLINGEKNQNIKLKSGDVLNIFSNSSMKYFENVSITGHVLRPGVRDFRKGMTFFDLVFSGGGFENSMHLINTYLEKAEITRLDENLNETVEFFRLDSLLEGNGAFGNEIRMGDRIRIYSKSEVLGDQSNVVTIEGFVKRPGAYPLSQDMRLKDLLFLAGGFQDSSHISQTFLNKADLFRKTKFGTKSVLSFNLFDVLNGDSSNNFLLLGDDEIFIYDQSINFTNKVVSASGSVKNPIQINFKDNMTVKDLIFAAGGPVLSNSVKDYKVEIIRPKSNAGKVLNSLNVITFNIDKDFIVNSKNKINNTLVEPFDMVYVRLNNEKSEIKKVEIEGAVKFPGEYVLLSTDEKVADIIQRAGGLTEDSYILASKFLRNGLEISISFEKILRNKRSKSNISLSQGDKIIIGYKSNMVTIEGEVNNPGTYTYDSGSRLSDYIDYSGGLTRDASRFSSYVVNPDGKTTKLSMFKLSPKIKDGARIVIGRKEDVEPFDVTEYVTNLTSIYTDLSQAYLMIILASRQ